MKDSEKPVGDGRDEREVEIYLHADLEDPVLEAEALLEKPCACGGGLGNDFDIVSPTDDGKPVALHPECAQIALELERELRSKGSMPFELEQFLAVLREKLKKC